VLVTQCVYEFLFPTPLERLIASLQTAPFADCAIRVERESNGLWRMLVTPRGRAPIETELYAHAIRSIAGEEDIERHIADSLNSGPTGSYYATRTLITRDAETGRVVRLEGAACPRLVGSTATFQDTPDTALPPCAVDVKAFTCLTK